MIFWMKFRIPGSRVGLVSFFAQDGTLFLRLDLWHCKFRRSYVCTEIQLLSYRKFLLDVEIQANLSLIAYTSVAPAVFHRATKPLSLAAVNVQTSLENKICYEVLKYST